MKRGKSGMRGGRREERQLGREAAMRPEKAASSEAQPV